MESKAVPGVHVLGDATLSAPAMPKSASMANNHAKIAAAAIVEILDGPRARAGADPQHLLQLRVAEGGDPRLLGARLGREGPHAEGGAGLGGVSAARSEAEGTYAWNWARTIWADSLGST